MKAIESITALGHKNILATNKNTFEITKDTHLTKQGDCIIAVAANKSSEDLRNEFRKILKKTGSKLTIIIEVDGEKEVVYAWGTPTLPLSHPTDLVVRKSSYVCDRTLAIRANKAAKDFSKNLIAKLKNPYRKVYITLIAEN
ncbi:MAG: DUF371 domain-containing protein [Candidatus Bathyarchaeia archaeon]